ncbi:ABC transporter substrate-binding protein [Aureimonas leprariae]|uniref:ABC transporter substrate-binding protein n=1 Tax=Plantimonas leprariae TaxID=2615207 RepID=A0A7V7TVD3_9HYPH|nr:ABC transporter substrate-binding protein [Aureimonas leprariae]KAB0677709.1 ABC transporter substrate-binding protein [Aureimonas leprariae]
MKHILKTLAVASGLLVGAATASFAATEITWWDFLSGGDGVRMKALIADFNKEHPDIHINATTSEWGEPFYTKVRTSAAVGQQPDVMTFHLSRVPLAVKEGVLSDITDEDLANAGLSKSDYFPRALESATEGGKLKAVPFDVHALVLYYNKDLLSKAGLLGPDGKPQGIGTIDEFNAALAKLKEQGVETPVSFQTGGEGGTWRVFYTLLAQQGGKFMDGNKVLDGDNAAKAQKALAVMTDWVSKGFAPQQAEYEASVALFSSGKSAFQLNGVWEVPTYTDLAEKKQLGFEWGAIQVPAWMGQQATWADSHSFAIPQSPQGSITGEKRKAVMTVIGWMNKHSIRWANAGHIPAYKPVADSDEFKKMEPNATYSVLAETAVYDPRSNIAGVGGPIYDAALNIMSPAINGFMTPEEAVTQMQESLGQLAAN